MNQDAFATQKDGAEEVPQRAHLRLDVLRIILLLLLMGWLSQIPRPPQSNKRKTHPFVDGAPIHVYGPLLEQGVTHQ